MWNMWRKIFGTAALTFMLCLTGLVMIGTAFADRCVDNGDKSVTDISTGLMWKNYAAGPMNWEGAMSFASSRSLGDNSGWRLPTKDELEGLYYSPCKTMMQVVSSYYWSSTTRKYSDPFAWRVDLSNGNMDRNDKSGRYYVCPVRDAQ